MKKAKEIPITVMGHKAKIRLIGYSLGIPPAWHGDHFTIWIDLEDPVNGLSGFGIEIPIDKNYNKEEFMTAVKYRAEGSIKAHLSRVATQQEGFEAKRIKEEALKLKVDEVKRLIGM